MGDELQSIRERIAELKRKEHSGYSNPIDTLPLGEIKNRIAELKAKESAPLNSSFPGETPEESSYLGHLGRLGAETVGHGLIDIPEGIAALASMSGAEELTPEEEAAEAARPKFFESIHNLPFLNKESPQNLAERVGAEALRTGVGLGGITTSAKNIPALFKMGAKFGATKQGLEELGVAPGKAALAAMVAEPLAHGAVRGFKGVTSGISPSAIAERKIRERMGEILPEKSLPKHIQELDNAQKAQYLEGYEPLTAEVATSPALAGMQKSFEGSLKHPDLAEGITERKLAQSEAIQNALNEMHPVERGETIQNLMRDYEAEQARALAAREENARKVAAEQFASPYQNLEPHELPVHEGKELKEVIAQELKDAKIDRAKKAGPKYTQLQNLTLDYKGDKVPLALEPLHSRNVLSKWSKIENTDDVNKLISKYTRRLKGAKQLVVNPGTGYAKSIENAKTVAGLESGALRQIGDDLKTYGTDTSGGYFLLELKSGIEKDLAAYPQVAEARGTYKKLSHRVNELSPYKKIIQKKDFDVNDLIGASGAPQAAIGKGDEAISSAQEFVKKFGSNKKAMDVVTSYATRKAAFSILDKNGLATEERIHNFKKRNPHLFVLDPKLETKLSNVKNANALINKEANELGKKVSEGYNQVFTKVAGKEGNEVIPYLFGENAKQKGDALWGVMQHSPTGQEATRQGIAEYAKNTVNTPAAFRKFFRRGHKQMSRYFSTEHIDALNKIDKHMQNMQALETRRGVKGSQTAPMLKLKSDLERAPFTKRDAAELLGIHGAAPLVGLFSSHPLLGGMMIPITVGVSAYKNAISKSFGKNVQRMLLDVNYAKGILQDINTAKGRKAADTFFGKWRENHLKGYALGASNKIQDAWEKGELNDFILDQARKGYLVSRNTKE